ncbi:UTP15 family protein [Megaselia abdita]
MTFNNFHALNTRKYRKSENKVTKDTLYWKQLGLPSLVKEFGAIDYIDFSNVEPYNFAATCSVRVQIYSPITKLVAKNLSKFQENAYGGSFRKDGRLLVAGDEEGNVKLFDTNSKHILRLFKGHSSAVHRTFFTPDLQCISSFSDDKTVKLWDISTEKLVQSYEKHQDYVRAGCVNPTSSDIVASGGYDNIINLYDFRTNSSTIRMDHGCSIESMIFLPSGGILLSAGGTEIRVWDVISGGKLLAKLSHHHKTITCLHVSSNGKRIFSGGLDRHVKIYDVSSYQAVHTLTFPNSVLSLGVAPNDQTVVAGMVDGLISIQNMENNDVNLKSNLKEVEKKEILPIYIDHDIPEVEDKQTETHYDHWLRKYEYVKALDYVLKPYVISKNPHVTISVLQELIHRKGLKRAITGKKNSIALRLCKFITKFLSEHRFMRVLIDVANILLDVYKDSAYELTGDLGKHIVFMATAINKEIHLTNELCELRGCVETLIDSSNKRQTDATLFISDKLKLDQSAQAEKSSILVV